MPGSLSMATCGWDRWPERCPEPRYDVTKFAGVHPGGTQILLECLDSSVKHFKVTLKHHKMI